MFRATAPVRGAHPEPRSGVDIPDADPATVVRAPADGRAPDAGAGRRHRSQSRLEQSAQTRRIARTIAWLARLCRVVALRRPAGDKAPAADSPRVRPGRSDRSAGRRRSRRARRSSCPSPKAIASSRAIVVARSTRATRARAAARAGRARAGRGAAAAAAGRRARRGHPPGRGAGRRRRRRRRRGRRPSSPSAEADLAALRDAARSPTPARSKQRDDAATRRDVAQDRVRGRARARVSAAREGARRGCAPARGREEIDAARARVAAADAQIATLEKSHRRRHRRRADRRHRHREAASRPASWSRRARRSSSSPTSITRGPNVYVDEPHRAAAAARPAGDGLHRRRRRRHSGHRQLHLAEGRVHAAQRADGRGALEARLPRARSPSTTRDGVLKQGMPVEAEIPFCSRSHDRDASRARSSASRKTLRRRPSPCDELSLVGRARRDVRPDRPGRRRQDDDDPADLRAAARRRGHGPRARPRSGAASIARSPQSVGYLSQRFSLYGDLSIDENIAFFAEIHGVARLPRAPRSAARDDAATPFRTRLADQLSGGMKQKLALACTLVHEPRADPARRADDRRRSGVAPRVLEAAVGVPRRRASRS